MFQKIESFSQNGILAKEINKRVQFFFNYWTLTISEYRNIIRNENGFESHRSLLTKIDYQLTDNYEYAKSKFERYLKNPIFDSSNCISNQQSIQRNISKIDGYLNSGYKTNKDKIQKSILNIKRNLLIRNEYDKLLTTNLYSILNKNTPLNDDEIKNIKFLVEALIIELFNDGYSVDYIKKIPQIFTFSTPSDLRDFPFEKSESDFNFDKDLYNSYLINETRNLTLGKIIMGFNKLLNKDIIDGFIIFKIENITLQNPNSIKIGEVEFYNPNVVRKIKTASLANPKIVQKIISAEHFVQDLSINNSQISGCNSISPLKYRNFIPAKYQRTCIEIYRLNKKALAVLNNVINKHYSGYEIEARIQLKNHIFLHNNFKLAKYSPSIFEDINFVFDDSQDEFSHFKQIPFTLISNLNRENLIEKKLYNIYTTQKEVELDHDFSFKNLWIVWESILPGVKPSKKKEKLIELTKKVYKKNFQTKFLSDIKMFLVNNLSKHHFTNIESTHFLEDKVMRKIGLSTEFGKNVSIRKFRNNYKKLKDYCPIQIIELIVLEIENFLINQENYESKIDKWISNTIEDIYVERNAEVHSNHHNHFSQIRLKGDFIFISNLLTTSILFSINRNNRNDLEKIIEKICA